MADAQQSVDTHVFDAWHNVLFDVETDGVVLIDVLLELIEA